MSRQEKLEMCKAFFDILSERLEGRYEILGSCNKDNSAYLCPIGTTGEVTYYSKPELSFRISDHWNWYANINKCSDPKYVQCYCSELPYPKKRDGENRAGKPIWASCVSIFINGKYRVVYGEYFDRKEKTWKWLDNNVENILSGLIN